jgi:hypothetical protein
MGGGVQLGPLGTAANNTPIVPAPADYDDGEVVGIIGRGNRSTRRKRAPMPLCPPQTPHAARLGGKLATNRLSCRTTSKDFSLKQDVAILPLNTMKNYTQIWPTSSY